MHLPDSLDEKFETVPTGHGRKAELKTPGEASVNPEANRGFLTNPGAMRVSAFE